MTEQMVPEDLLAAMDEAWAETLVDPALLRMATIRLAAGLMRELDDGGLVCDTTEAVLVMHGTIATLRAMEARLSKELQTPGPHRLQ
jgi:hypothetical protein